MQRLSVVVLLALCTACSSVGNVTKKSDSSTTTYEQHAGRTLPIKERAFVTAVEVLDKKAIIAQLGEPAKADDVKLKGSNKVVASIWHYHNINTDENGQYFETTELDFIEDKVVQVVFLNNDGSEEEDQSYDIPQDQSSH